MSMNITENSTHVQSDVERGLALVYLTLVVTVGLFFNSYILYSSYRHKAIKLCEISLMFVHNITATDLVWTLLTFFPAWVSMIAKRWILGDTVCWIVANWLYMPPFNKMLGLFSFSGAVCNKFCNAIIDIITLTFKDILQSKLQKPLYKYMKCNVLLNEFLPFTHFSVQVLGHSSNSTSEQRRQSDSHSLLICCTHI